MEYSKNIKVNFGMRQNYKPCKRQINKLNDSRFRKTKTEIVEEESKKLAELGMNISKIQFSYKVEEKFLKKILGKKNRRFSVHIAKQV